MLYPRIKTRVKTTGRSAVYRQLVDLLSIEAGCCQGGCSCTSGDCMSDGQRVKIDNLKLKSTQS